MCETEYSISKELIDQMHQMVSTEQEEICIILNADTKNKLTFSNIRKTGFRRQDNKPGKTRASCDMPVNPNFKHIFHFHPKASRSYPSVEDVVYMLRHIEVKLSLIATRWGLYIIKQTPESLDFYNRYRTLDKEDMKEKFGNILKEIIDNLGGLENYKGYKTQQYLPLSNSNINFINKQLKEIRRKTGIKINFCSWSLFNKSLI